MGFPPTHVETYASQIGSSKYQHGNPSLLKKTSWLQLQAYKGLYSLNVAISQNAARLTLRYFSKGSMMSKKSTVNLIWLVVSTHLKNISQTGSFLQVRVKIKNVWNHHLVMQRVLKHIFCIWDSHHPVMFPCTPQAPRDFRESSRARSTGNMTEKRCFFRPWKPKGAPKYANKAAGHSLQDFFPGLTIKPWLNQVILWYVPQNIEKSSVWGNEWLKLQCIWCLIPALWLK